MVVSICISQLGCHVVFQQVSDSWRAFLLLSLCLQLASWMLIIYWSRHHWRNHPISQTLQAHIQPLHSGWGSVAASINTEFRRIDKFATGVPGARVIITDNWVLRVSKKSGSVLANSLWTEQPWVVGRPRFCSLSHEPSEHSEQKHTRIRLACVANICTHEIICCQASTFGFTSVTAKLHNSMGNYSSFPNAKTYCYWPLTDEVNNDYLGTKNTCHCLGYIRL